MRNQVTFECTVCKERNYIGTRNKKSKQEKMEFSKYCPRCKKHTKHKETK